MRRIGFREWCLTAALLCLQPQAWTPLVAQNDNETAGQLPNHVFDAGQVGENIDVLNGGLYLRIPIGQEYKVSSNLSYQLALNYNSKVWDTSDWGSTSTVHLARNNNVGLGFSMSFGRIYRDVTLRSEQSGGTAVFYTWVYVSPDGAEHELGSEDTFNQGCTIWPLTQTYDGTFYGVGNMGGLGTWNGISGTPPAMVVTTPDGIRYTFGHVVQAFDAEGYPYNRATGCTGSSSISALYRDFNRDFGGWYVTLIEDLKSDFTIVDDPGSPRDGQPGFAAYVEVTYDVRPGFEHAIASLRDSAGRQVDFNNDCPRNQTTGACLFTAGDPTPPQRRSVRTESIELPAFAGTTALYGLAYEYTTLRNLLTHPSTCCDPSERDCTGTGLPNCPAPARATNILTRVDYPEVTPVGGNAQRYSMLFGYGNPQTRNGELAVQVLPTGAAHYYYWDSYVYSASSGRGGYLDVVATGFTRALHRKVLTMNPADPLSLSGEWTYTRVGGAVSTNPSQVNVVDPVGNETVYYFSASQPENFDFYDRSDLNDGYAPEWDDGLNTRIEIYQGNGGARKLIRTESRSYEYDPFTIAHSPARKDVRMNRVTVTHNDDGGRQSTTSFGSWNGQGLWRVMTESGFDIPATRTTRTDYFSRDPAHFNFREVSDGFRVLSRTDNRYAGTRLLYSVDRVTLPVKIGTGSDTSAAIGDVVTGISYDSLGNVVVREIGDSGVSGTTVNTPDQRISFTWAAGGYRASERYSDLSTGQDFSWKASDRSLDGNTGLAFESRDTAGVLTTFSYDALGRLLQIRAPAPEHPIEFRYADIHHAMRRQGDPAVMGSSYTCAGAASGDFTMDCAEYDNLGQLLKIERRPMDLAGGVPYQTMAHDILGRTISASEWALPGQTPSITTYDYADPGSPSQSDPLGRVRRITRPDGTVTQTRYFGNSMAVTVKDVRGLGGEMFDAETVYYRDGWNRLVYVQPPIGGGASAYYGHDLLDNVVYVEQTSNTSGQRQVRTLEYDPLGRLRSSSTPESGSLVVTAYNALGQPLEQMDSAGTTLLFEYDGAGRKTAIRKRAIQLPGQPQPPLLTLTTFAYDSGIGLAAGKLVSTTSNDDAGAWSHTRNLQYVGLNGRLSADSQFFAGWTGSSAALGYAYNSFGLLSDLTYPEGAPGKGGAYAVKYVYQNGWRKRVDDPGTLGSHAMASYTAAGEYKDVVTYGGFKTQIDRDAMSRPGRIIMGRWNWSTNQFASQEYDSGTFQYDGAGNVSAMGVNRYAYDGGMRLVEAETMSDILRRQTFVYDDFGNMTARDLFNAGGGLLSSTRYTMNDAQGRNRNRIVGLRQQGDTSDRPFFSDVRGNLTHTSFLAGSHDYHFDARGRMTAIQALQSAGALDLSKSLYDDDGFRVRKSDSVRGIQIFYVRDSQGRLMSEFRLPEGESRVPEWTRHYIFLDERLVGLRENQVPSPPGGLRATTSRQGQSGLVNLFWEANQSDENVTSYKIYRSLESTIPSWTLVTTTSALSYTDTQPAGTRVQYAATAVAGGSESYGSRLLLVEAGETTSPTVPAGLSGSPGDRRVDLAWSDNASSERVVGYHVYRDLASSQTTTRITSVPVSRQAFTDLEVSNDMLYRYRVGAVDNVGLESAPSTSVLVMPRALTPPGPPIGLTVSADCDGGSAIHLSWDPDAQGAPMTRFLVYRNPAFSDLTGLPPQSRDAGISSLYSDTEVTPGTTYRYWVVAEGTAGILSASTPLAGAVAPFPRDLVPTPETPYASSGDGQVKLRIPVDSFVSSLPSMAVYRRPNAARQCESYERLAVVPRIGGGSPPSLDYFDTTVPNGAAYDYVVTNIDSQGRESAFSTPALGIPLGRPLGFTQCVEDLGPTWADGAEWCGTRYARIALQWNAPAARPYQPLYATNATGELGYLKGYRIYNYYRRVFGNLPYVVELDLSWLKAQSIDYSKSYCSGHTDIACGGGPVCPGTEMCTSTSTVGSCSPSGGPCMLDGDCPTGSVCQNAPPDPFLGKFGQDRIFTDYRKSGFGDDCLTPKAVYKIYANGNWLTVESGFGDNFDVAQIHDPYSRCLEDAVDVCNSSTAFKCPSPKKKPPVPAAPAPTPIEGGIRVTWTPPQGLCEPTTRSTCWLSCPSGGCGDCPTGQQCEPCESTDGCAFPYGICRTPFQTCEDDTDCGDGQECASREEGVASYRLYITEFDRVGGLGSDTTDYHFVRPAHVVEVPAGQLAYTFTGIADKANMVTPKPFQFSFRVAAVDHAGRVSDASPPSAAASPLPDPGPGSIPSPHSVKTILWTVNDATKVGNRPSPRGFGGIKIAWQGQSTYPGTFRGYRVWRRDPSGGSFCALLASDPHLGFPVCLDPGANPADSVTTTTDRYLQTYVDRTAEQNKTYSYAVTAVTSTGESPKSSVVNGVDLGHETPPLSPPAYFKAWAPTEGITFIPVGSNPNPGARGIYLRWCPNPSAEGITAYRVYRSQRSMGPYNFLAEISPTCLEGSRRCEIRTTGVTEAACQPGVYSNCRIVDLTVNQPPEYVPLNTAVDQYVYHYVVTAVSAEGESGYSAENSGWPHYSPLYCVSHAPTEPNKMTCHPRYDPDNPPDIPCGDENASLRPGEPSGHGDFEMAPYRVVGQKKPPGDGDGGPPAPPVAPPTPNALPRFVYYHLDHLGSPRVITNPSGFVVSKHHYLPFGEEIPFAAQGNTGTRQFTGHERDKEIQLDYMLARYYSPSLGRFLSPDPRRFESLSEKDKLKFMMNPQRWNRFVYALNNPLKLVDPDGEDATPANKPKGGIPEWLRWLMEFIGLIPAPGNPVGARQKALDADKVELIIEVDAFYWEAFSAMNQSMDPDIIEIAQEAYELRGEARRADDEFDHADARAKLEALKLRLRKWEEERKRKEDEKKSQGENEARMPRPRDCLGGGWTPRGYPYVERIRGR